MEVFRVAQASLLQFYTGEMPEVEGIKMLARVKNGLSRTVRRDDGSSIIELAIVFPILFSSLWESLS